MRDLPVAGKITIFYTLAISKIVHLALVKVITISTILELDQTKKSFIWKNGNPNFKQDTLCKNYENGDLKNVAITFKTRGTINVSTIAIIHYFLDRRLSEASVTDSKKF